MRVIAGQFRSRPLLAPPGTATRPTSDRLRETLMNVLSPRLAGARFADLYAGSGAVGIEALSRGAAFCLFAEKAPGALGALRKNLQALAIDMGFAVDSRGVARGLADDFRQGQPFDLVFLDPPYDAAEEYERTLQKLGRAEGSLVGAHSMVVAEHARRSPLHSTYGNLRRARVLEQGDSALSFYGRDEPAATR